MTEAVERGPRVMARELEAKIVELTERRKKPLPAAEDKEIGRRIKAARMLLRWCKTRAGY